ncbi:alpha/beta fold hydrolase [Intrasporangium flavum]|uniref:alpha/beta fold hydrolase n=1 Tax=Intrasporangium flavum TaxID=1428657 RepID=UPI001F5FFF00|nr:alpha/beta fold hydrolase [Intrasporangium flavum]
MSDPVVPEPNPSPAPDAPGDPSVVVDVRELDVAGPDGAVLRAYDTGAPDGVAEPLVVVWFHGTPNIGPPPAPLFDAGRRHGVRWVGYDRPGYGGSTPRPDRSVASAAGDLERVLDHLGIDTFAAMGHSGGGPHALAAAALLPDRVRSVVAMSPVAPYGPVTAEGLDWFAGLAPAGEASLRAAVAGREAKEAHEAGLVDGPEQSAEDIGFLPVDEVMFDGPWRWLVSVVRPALAAGAGPVVDDDLAYVRDWGFDPAEVTAPTLVVHGDADGMVPASHGRWLAGRVPGAELWVEEGGGHISVLSRAEDALDWLAEHAGG